MLGQILALTSFGVVIYWFNRDARALKHYEETFYDTYSGAYGNQVVPSDFRESKDPQMVGKLCGYSYIRRNLSKTGPKIEVHPISFKRIKRPDILAEVLRCKRNTAIIQAPRYNGYDCAYLLRLRKHAKDTPSFYIYQKFCYADRKVRRVRRSLSGEENIRSKEDPNYSASLDDVSAAA